MSITAVNQGTSLAGAGTRTAQSTNRVYDETKNQFLQMLITQLKNQDPFAPQDSTQFAQQMMQMGQLEQLMTLNSSVDGLVAAQQGGLISQYSGMVGKGVMARGSTFELIQGQPAEIKFEIPEVPKSVTVNVFDLAGKLVRQMDTGITEMGGYTLTYDGQDKSGQPLPGGYYNYTVVAMDHDDNPITANTYSTGRISSVRLSNGSPVFQMGNRDMGMEEIERIF